MCFWPLAIFASAAFVSALSIAMTVQACTFDEDEAETLPPGEDA